MKVTLKKDVFSQKLTFLIPLAVIRLLTKVVLSKSSQKRKKKGRSSANQLEIGLKITDMDEKFNVNGKK